VFIDARTLAFRLRSQKYRNPERVTTATTARPIPIPALAPEERPLKGEGVGEGMFTGKAVGIAVAIDCDMLVVGVVVVGIVVVDPTVLVEVIYTEISVSSMAQYLQYKYTGTLEKLESSIFPTAL
jgi:hypothetical protein